MPFFALSLTLPDGLNRAMIADYLRSVAEEVQHSECVAGMQLAISHDAVTGMWRISGRRSCPGKANGRRP